LTYALLGAVRGALTAVAGDPARAAEAGALARIALAARLNPRPWPDYLAVTWAELLPSQAPALTDVDGLHGFTDWLTLCEMPTDFSPVALDTLGFGADQEDLLRDWSAGEPMSPWEEDRTRRAARSTVRRVLADL
jgi:hypothetical protein